MEARWRTGTFGGSGCIKALVFKWQHLVITFSAEYKYLCLDSKINNGSTSNYLLIY